MTTPLQAFILGLVSALHCVGMCGAIIGAVSLSLPPLVRNDWRLLAGYTLTYNLGRILSYALAGFLVTLLGHSLSSTVSPRWGHLLLQLVGAVTLFATSLYLAGWFPRFAFLETLGAPVWRRLEPLWRRLVPVASPGHALLLGMVWGWMPCGLVYTALAVSLGAVDPWQGGATMALFGLGTLPGTMAAGWLVERMARAQRREWLQKGAAILLAVMGLASLVLAATGGEDHAGHAAHAPAPDHAAHAPATPPAPVHDHGAMDHAAHGGGR